MSKFLNETGLSYFWGKVKTFLKSTYVAIGDNITVGKSTIEQGLVKVETDPEHHSTMDSEKIVIENGDDYATRVDAKGVKVMGDDSTSGVSIDKSKIQVVGEDSQITAWEGSISMLDNKRGFEGIYGASGFEVGDDNGNDARVGVNQIYVKRQEDDGTATSVGTKKHGFSVSKWENGKVTSSSELGADAVTSPSFVKTGGTAVQILMADGSVKTLNVAGGVPTLDANGKIPLEQLGNLDTTLFQVVTALPTTGIVKNRIYLVKAGATADKNIYAEYIYTGDVAATYDASKWEKLGEYKSDVDLSGYSKKEETVKGLTINKNENAVGITAGMADNKSTSVITIAPASQTEAGVMSASDKKALDTLAARYPLSIASFNASPNLLEVGKASDISFSWSFNNTDFHPITAQTIAVDGAAAVAVANANKSYKHTALAGATSATTKSAVLKVNGSLSKSVNITYHYASYIGVVANGATVDATAVKALTKSIEWGKGKTSAISQTNQKIVYAYPASYGDLTSIKDGNGFQGFNGYTKKTLTIDGQNYNVYVQNIAATSSSTYTFA